MTPHDAQKVIRKLAAAEGYLELGMSARAIAEVDSAGDSGPFEAIAQLLRGEALQHQNRLEEAIPALNRAAELFPKPFNQRALLGLSVCYRARGETDLADQMVAEASPPNLPEGAVLQLVVTPIFHVQTSKKRMTPPKG